MIPKDIQSLAGQVFVCPLCTGYSLTKVQEFKEYWRVSCHNCDWLVRWMAKDEDYDIEFLKQCDFKITAECSHCRLNVPSSKMAEHVYMVHKRKKS